MLPHASATLTVHTWVVKQPETVVELTTAMGVFVPKPQPSVTAPAAVTTLALVGKTAGLQPSDIVLFVGSPSAHNANVGAVVSVVQVYVTEHVPVLAQASVTLTVHVSVVTQPTVDAGVVTDAFGVLVPKPQPSVIVPAAVIAMPAVGGLGLQPKLIVLFAVLPSVHNAKVGATISSVQV